MVTGVRRCFCGTDRRGCFSSGDGSTTFRVSDLITRKAHIRALDPADTERDPGAYQPDQYPEHSHGLALGDRILEADEPNMRAIFEGGTTYNEQTDVSGTGEENRVANYNLLPCIKY